MTNKIRVLVVDDSLVMRQLLSEILEKDSKIKVIGTARNGVEAVIKTVELQPSVITLDIEMPKMDGLTALQYIMNEHPVPVVMLSAMNKRQADIVIKALEMGAVDFIAKTSGTLSLDIEDVREEIISKIKDAAKVEVKQVVPKTYEKIIVSEFKAHSKQTKIITIGASTGGPKALLEVLSSLPRDIPAGILIVQHMPEGFTKSLAERLNWQTSLEVKEAKEGDKIEPGIVYIAPGNMHMQVNGNKIHLTNGVKVNYIRPSIDVLMESVAKQYGPKAIGVLMTGMGSDGAQGMKMIKENNGRTIVQNKESSTVFGMPKAAINMKVADKVVPLEKIAIELIKLLQET
ncbi:MAG: chemotaxis response regulator protein-glutamate methylesterase [Candidatus Thorarchaeota archaeon]